ncbi:MAG: class I SAM-dependent methyltransferase, partial [Bacteroidota bacterium]|nr:class I SAM-dependent methyltransferase [Bacteroidota bacterium]
MELINQQILYYAENYSSPEDDLLREISDFTNQHHADAQMLSGHLQGKVLEIISYMVRPRRILEIGTFMGYSAICLAKGLADDGLLHTIELQEAEAIKAREFFLKSNLGKKIILHTGNALEILSKLDEIWDLVFIDADKPGY